MRITLDKLDEVASLAEELQVTKIEMEDHLAGLRQLNARLDELSSSWLRSGGGGAVSLSGPPKDGAGMRTAGKGRVAEVAEMAMRLQRELQGSVSNLVRLCDVLQDDVRMMRMVPVSTLLHMLGRSARDMAREMGKQVELQILGGEVEMDRIVLEGLRDPLIHLLRNAIDHGIETPAERTAKGKSARGTVTISVRRDGGRIVLVVEDDGAGINIDRIAECARRKHLVTEDELEGMGPESVQNLIFRPGFSSREIITEISGRGIGLDVVQVNLRRLKGSVRLESTAGTGTAFTLSVPVTLTTEHGLLVRLGAGMYALPSAAVERVQDIMADELIEVEASQAVLMNGRPVPVRDLAAVLGLPERKDARETLSIVILEKGGKAVALVVDEIVSEREIVVKPFRPPIFRVPNVSGGTLTGSGQIIMVLEPGDLVDSALRSARAGRRIVTGRDATVSRPRILVVDDSITTRTLEKNIFEGLGYEVAVAVDGRQAWDMLQQEARFDLVVSDIEMPNMDGFELTRLIKESDKYGDLPVIIVTSMSKEADRRRGVEVGADAYIVKGQFETKVLLDVVAQLL